MTQYQFVPMSYEPTHRVYLCIFQLALTVQRKEINFTLMQIKLRPYSLAITPARSVFPVPGAPYNSRPERIRSGQLLNSFGYCNQQQAKTELQTTKNKKMKQEKLWKLLKHSHKLPAMWKEQYSDYTIFEVCIHSMMKKMGHFILLYMLITHETINSYGVWNVYHLLQWLINILFLK